MRTTTLSLLVIGFVLLVISSFIVTAQETSSTPPPPPTQQQDVKVQAANFRLQGDEALKAKKYDTSIELYSSAVDLEPDNYLNYYKRASLYLIRGRNDRALRDLNQVLKFNPGHTQSLIRRGKLHLGFGSFDAAERDLRAALKDSPANSIILEALSKVSPGKVLLANARKYSDSRDYHAARDAWSKVLEIAVGNEDFLLERARCSKALGDIEAILDDTMKILRNNGRNIEATLLRGQALASSGDTETAIKFYRQGLKTDPDHKELKAEYSKVKVFNKAVSTADSHYHASQWQEAYDSYGEALTAIPDYKDRHIYHERRCNSLVQLRKAKEAIAECNAALAINEQLYEGHYFKGEAHLLLDDLDSAYREFARANNINPNDGRAINGLQRVERLQKMAKRKDYYKILGVEKDTPRAQIRKAYRKKALEWHPDKHPEDKKAEVELKFQEINEAYEVLNDDEKRGKYDRGEDLTENPGMQHQGFQQGSPFHFSFRYG